MKLPPREYYTVHEAAARWGCTLADIAGWSAKGRFDIVTGIPPTGCGDETIAGEVVVAAFDMLPMFRRSGAGPQTALVRRVRPVDHADWLQVTDPVPGVEVWLIDLMIAGSQVLKFEEEHDLMRRIAGGTGSISPYDWDGMMNALVVQVHEHGVPATQAELIRTMQDWFADQSDGDEIPDERSIRRRVSAIWKSLSQLRKAG